MDSPFRDSWNVSCSFGKAYKLQCNLEDKQDVAFLETSIIYNYKLPKFNKSSLYFVIRYD